MLKEGDLVRFRNSFLKTLGQRTRSKPLQFFRGKQQIMRVEEVVESFRWRRGKKTCERMARVDLPIGPGTKLSDGVVIRYFWISTEYLAFVKRPDKSLAPADADRWKAIAGPKKRKRK